MQENAPQYSRRYRGNPRQYYANRMEATAEAPNAGKPWTPEELAVALDTSLTGVQAARQLGRTWASVANVRRKRRGSSGTGRARGKHGSGPGPSEPSEPA
jgi:hypothetical protein